MQFVRSLNVRVDDANKGLQWSRTACTDCGACLPHCPTKALHVADPASRKVAFSGELCVECLSCIDNCPYGACSSIF